MHPSIYPYPSYPTSRPRFVTRGSGNFTHARAVADAARTSYGGPGEGVIDIGGGGTHGGGRSEQMSPSLLGCGTPNKCGTSVFLVPQMWCARH